VILEMEKISSMLLEDPNKYTIQPGSLEVDNTLEKIKSPLLERFEKCEGFSEIFELVKKVVKEALNQYRVGLMLVLADLPISVGAFHTLGSNTIVLNRTLLHLFEKTNSKYQKEFIFLILLHEYLHTLGHINEGEVRGLSYRIVAETFGVEHPLTNIAERGPFSVLPKLPQYGIHRIDENPELIKGFEKSNQTYIQ
jgi:hypothetical protein